MRLVIQWDYIVMIKFGFESQFSEEEKKIITLNSFDFSRFCDLLKIE